MEFRLLHFGGISLVLKKSEQMCSGVPPWHESKFDNLLHAFKTISLSDSLPDIPQRKASGFITSCLVRSVGDRPTAEDLFLHPFVTGTPIPKY